MAEQVQQKRITEILTPTQAAAAVMAEVILEEPNVFGTLDPFEQRIYLQAAKEGIQAYMIWGGRTGPAAAGKAATISGADVAGTDAWQALCRLELEQRARRLVEILGERWDELFGSARVIDAKAPAKRAVIWALYRWPWPETVTGMQVAALTHGKSHSTVVTIVSKMQRTSGPSQREAVRLVGVLAQAIGEPACAVADWAQWAGKTCRRVRAEA